MDEDDVQRPLHYAALRRSPTTKPGAKQLFAKAACGVDDPAPKAVPLNDRRADIFGNTEFLHGLGECDVARRRSIGGYLIVEQRQNREFHNYSEFNWSRLASDANGDTVPRTQTIYTYQLTDPLGSVAVQVRMIDNNTYTANATQSERNPRYLNFDAHGKQRAGNGRTAVDNNGDSDTIDPGEEALTAWQPLSYFSEQRTRPEGTWQGYAGHETYNSVGIVHMKGRIYDPTLGRFLQPDPIVEDDLNPQTWNRYTYVRNNPMTFTDPTGFTTNTETRPRDGCGDRCQAREGRQRQDWADTGGSFAGNTTFHQVEVTISGAATGVTKNTAAPNTTTTGATENGRSTSGSATDDSTNAETADAIAEGLGGGDGSLSRAGFRRPSPEVDIGPFTGKMGHDGMGPPAPFGTYDEAVQEGARAINREPLNESYEHRSDVVRGASGFYYSVPVTSRRKNGVNVGEYVLPAGNQKTAILHSHPDGGPMPAVFSQADTFLQKREGVPVFIVRRSGDVHWFDHTKHATLNVRISRNRETHTEYNASHGEVFCLGCAK